MVNDAKMDRNKKPHSQSSQGQSDEERIEEIETIREHGAYDKVYEMAEKFASTYVGQFVIDRGDRLLKTVEETAKWSLPRDKDEANLERPLSWLPFLSLILTLRLTCMWLSIAALMIGNSPVTPQNMVYFLQTRRRKLRAIRMTGIKVIRKREGESMWSAQGRRGLIYKLSSLLSSAICRPGQHNERARRVFVQYNRRRSIEEIKPEAQATKRPREECNEETAEEKAELNLTCNELLDKYANENSDDDSDFVPNLDDNDSTSSGTENTSGETEDESTADQPTNGTSKNTETDKNEGNNLSIEFLQNGAKERDMPKPIIDIKSEPLAEADQLSVQKEVNGPSNGDEKQDVDVVNEANIATSNNKNSQSPSNTEHHERGHDSAVITQRVNINTLMDPLQNSTQSSSNSSLDSFKTSDDIYVNEFENESSTTATNTEPTSAKPEYTRLNSASSSEDIFHSPIGSPAEFKAMFQPVSILKNSNAAQRNQNMAHSTPEFNEENDNNFNNARINKLPTQPQPQRPHPNNNFQHRYRGKNRR